MSDKWWKRRVIQQRAIRAMRWRQRGYQRKRP